LMQLQVGEGTSYFASFMDEYARSMVPHALLLGMDGIAVSVAAPAAIATLPKGEDGRPREKPGRQSDKGSGVIAREILLVLKGHGLGHHRIRPHCPEENGVIDRRRVGVGGHSYGAFMTANLLAHSDLFRAGIARSGAYNRTLTPFGFQTERRTFWQAPE